MQETIIDKITRNCITTSQKLHIHMKFGRENKGKLLINIKDN